MTEPVYRMDITQPADIPHLLVRKFTHKRWAGTETEFIDYIRGDYGHLLFIRDSYHREKLFENYKLCIWYGSDGRLRIVDQGYMKIPRTNWGESQCSFCGIIEFQDPQMELVRDSLEDGTFVKYQSVHRQCRAALREYRRMINAK